MFYLVSIARDGRQSLVTPNPMAEHVAKQTAAWGHAMAVGARFRALSAVDARAAGLISAEAGR